MKKSVRILAFGLWIAAVARAPAEDVTTGVVERLVCTNLIEVTQRIRDSEVDAGTIRNVHVDIDGFVYREPGLVSNQFGVGRIFVTCCAADASRLGVFVEWDQAPGLADGTWVRVEGVLDRRAVKHILMPVLRASRVTRMETPADSNLYPPPAIYR